MPHSFGIRARTRSMFSRDFRKKGVIPLTPYLKTYKVGDIVDIKCNAAVQKGMPHKFYHGRTGIVFNISKSAVGVIVNKIVGNRYIEKRVNIRVEHIKHSSSRDGFLKRVKENSKLKKIAQETGVRQMLKRQPEAPRKARVVRIHKGIQPITVTPAPYETLI